MMVSRSSMTDLPQFEGWKGVLDLLGGRTAKKVVKHRLERYPRAAETDGAFIVKGKRHRLCSLQDVHINRLLAVARDAKAILWGCRLCWQLGSHWEQSPERFGAAFRQARRAEIEAVPRGAEDGSRLFEKAAASRGTPNHSTVRSSLTVATSSTTPRMRRSHSPRKRRAPSQEPATPPRKAAPTSHANRRQSTGSRERWP